MLMRSIAANPSRFRDVSIELSASSRLPADKVRNPDEYRLRRDPRSNEHSRLQMMIIQPRI